MQHGIPVGNVDIEGLNFPQNLCGIDKKQNDNFQGVRQFNAQPALQDSGNREQTQRQYSKKDVFKVAIKNLCHHDQYD